ncbi:TNT antitoxin family protein [Mycobacterium lentiflavum]|uniref:TNT antitoxin family protein n=1 Tax=Mycobacterium lentiflavum TaxID=141349 RepID=A0ABY3UT76_MYCLN|nr:TNT antitoxin family protein [Mycobacterium lentiflavum]ULP40473.1 TNT antitoxin family protein [Mycobacterium lentiflavum]
MTEPVEIAPELAAWAKVAGYSVAHGSQTADGRATFSASLGEIRLLIGRRSENGLFVITDSDRMGPEQFILAAPLMRTIERYLFGRFGLEIRSQRSLPRVKVPTSREELSPGFNIEMRGFDDVEHWALIKADSTLVAIGSTDQTTGTADLVKLSLYLTATIEDICTAVLDPDGKPIFELR